MNSTISISIFLSSLACSVLYVRLLFYFIFLTFVLRCCIYVLYTIFSMFKKAAGPRSHYKGEEWGGRLVAYVIPLVSLPRDPSATSARRKTRKQPCARTASGSSGPTTRAAARPRPDRERSSCFATCQINRFVHVRSINGIPYLHCVVSSTSRNGLRKVSTLTRHLIATDEQ
jgi:hypothetical protein